MSETRGFHYGLLDSGELTADNLPVEGTIPAWLTGTLLRNGPGSLHGGQQRYRHWFDGMAMLHKFSFENGRVSYASKFMQTRALKDAEQTGRIAYPEFATDPCRSLFQRAMAVFTHQPTDNAKVSITRFADRMLALAETPIQVEFDPDTLASAGVFQYESEAVGQMTTAHPHIDGDNMYNVVTRYGPICHNRLYRVPAADTLQAELVGQVSTMRPSYMHSFGMTENYAIITAFPFVVNPLSLLFWLKPFIENFYWDPRRGTPFYVLNRHTGELVGRYECDPFFAFHHVNAFERDGEIVLDIVAYPDAEIITHYYLHRLEQPSVSIPFGKLRRYRVPLNSKSKRVQHETISDACIELPTFDYANYNTRADYHYVYGIGINPQRRDEFYNQIVKIDAQTGNTQTWHTANCYPGEPVFVPAPDRQAEDDGVLLSIVLDGDARRSFLLVLDAATLHEIGRAQIPQAVMFGFHGSFYPPES